MNMLLVKIKYNKHKWMVREDSKVLSMLWISKGDIPNTHAFCLYGTAELKMNTRFVSNGRKEEFTVGEKNILNESLVSPGIITTTSH